MAVPRTYNSERELVFAIRGVPTPQYYNVTGKRKENRINNKNISKLNISLKLVNKK